MEGSIDYSMDNNWDRYLFAYVVLYWSSILGTNAETCRILSADMETCSVPQIGNPGMVRLFCLSEAQALLPEVQTLTKRAYSKLEPIQSNYRRLLSCDPRKKSLAKEYEDIVRGWISYMERLGLVALSLWEVKFDTGDGYLSWIYPEIRIAYFVDSEDPMRVRQSLSDVIEEIAPHWAY